MVTTVTSYTDELVQSDVASSRAEAPKPISTRTGESTVTISLSGEPARVALVPDTEFRPRELDTANEYHAALTKLSEASDLTQRLADRLTDPLDGKTVEGIRFLIAHHLEAPPGFVDRMRGYFYGVLASGGTLDPTTGSVHIPPLPRSAVVAAIDAMPAFQASSFDTTALIEHLFDPRPHIGQGYCLFKSSADWERFVALVEEQTPAIRGACARLREIFDHVSETGSISTSDRAEYVRLSRDILSAQEATLEKILDPFPGAFDPLTRVILELRPGLATDVTVVPYSTAFKAELTRISGDVLTAANLIPTDAKFLCNSLRDQVRWCLTSSATRGWGEPSERWIDLKTEGAAFDFQFHCAESVSLFVEKRNFQLSITQPLSSREIAALDLEGPQISFPPGYGAPQTATPFVRLLTSSGVARYPVAARESTFEALSPAENGSFDPAQSVEIQKQPILVNVVPLGITHDTKSLRDISPTLVDDLSRASIIADALRAANRPDSATQYILGTPGELTAHGYTLAGAIGNATRCRSDTIQPVIDVLVGYETLVCLRGNTMAPVELSTLRIVQELERQGAISLDVSSGGLRITYIDPAKLREITRTLQHQLQLWQLGLPLASQRKIFETFEALPLDRSLAPEGLTFARRLDQVTRRRLREEARAEVEAFFTPETIAPIVEKLTPLLETIPTEALVPAPPGDREVHTVLFHHQASPSDLPAPVL